MDAYERDRTSTYEGPDEPTRAVRRVDRIDSEVRVDRSLESDGYESEHARRVEIYRRIAAVVWTICGFVEIVVALRVLFKLLAANAGNGFVKFIYDLSGVFVDPFQGMVNNVTSGSSILEINSLIAMLIFALIAWGVLKLVWLVLMVTEPSQPT